jgi:transcriptional regulator with PAS, ATPase and Fis domain
VAAPRIGHIIFHAGLIDLCTEVYQEFKNNIAGIEIVQPDPLDEKDILYAAKKIEKKCDILISRVDTVELLSKKLNIPVIARSVTFTNVLDALKKARIKGRRIALICHYSQDYKLSDWPSILGIEVAKFFYYSRQDALNAVHEAKRFNPDVVVGGVLVAKHAADLSLSCEILQINKDTIVQSIWKALDVFRALQKEKDYIKKFQLLLDFLHEGFIFLDKNYNITYVNDCACKIFKANKTDLLNKNLFTVLHNIISREGIASLQMAVDDQINNPHLGLLLPHEEGNIVANIVRSTLKDPQNRIIITFTEALQLQTIEYKVRKQLSNKGLVAKFTLNDIIGSSNAIKQAKEKASAFANTDSTVLLYGETGTGKEIFAHSIHKQSSRAKGPFVTVNCSALPKELAESELFGYEEGAFTGAKKAGKPGIFELAHNGTLFLDEIGTMPLDLQAKLLRIIQEKEVSRLGGTRRIPVNVRIIAATNNNLEIAVQEGVFRRDLYFRLNVLLLQIPPLRERPEDIPLLFNYFVKNNAIKLHINIDIFNVHDLSFLAKYSWPGNVREIENFAERYVALAKYHPAPSFLLKELFEEIKRGLTSCHEKPENYDAIDANEPTLSEARFTTERELLLEVGKKVNWNRKKMAQILNISQATLWRKMKKVLPEVYVQK